jgi:hypothetical protein
MTENDICKALNRTCHLWADRYRPRHSVEIPAKVRRWSGSPLSHYNGFTGEERIAGWQVTKHLQQRGLLPRPSECELCGHQGRVGFHSEHYYDPWSVIALCVGCHGVAHRRFRYPASWIKRIEQNPRRVAQSGLAALPSDVIDFAGWLQKGRRTWSP